jgi:hypothetical protein
MSDIVSIEGQAQLEWHATVGPSGRWIGVCKAMNLASEAESLDELYSVINETMQLMLFDLLADNELDRFLKDHGWKAMHLPHHVKNPEDIQFRVPWSLIAKGDGPRRGPQQRSR